MREVVCTGPEPEPGCQWCVMCAIRFKAEALELPEIQETIQSLMRGDEKLGPAVVDLVKLARGRAMMPKLSVALGIAPSLNNALVPLCWGHIQAIRFSAVQPVAGSLPDASQVPLISGRR